ncbi:MAG: hypothetical protein OET90_03390 [Desulfuromonadales bacterium]|nr:hypothetical protein [Desulfuromonadales bacterium]
MEEKSFDPRLCVAALEGLKAFNNRKFTVDFLLAQGVPQGASLLKKPLLKMWEHIGEQICHDAAKCQSLWEHVDQLRLWGKQRVFLYRIDATYIRELSNPNYVRKLVGSVFNKPLFKWEALPPFLARAEYVRDPQTEERLLVFKYIENRTYFKRGEHPTDGAVREMERATNYLRINLDSGHAELRMQKLQAGAENDALEERKLLEEAIGETLDMGKFKRISLTPVINVMLREPVYTIKAARINFHEPEVDADAPEVIAFLNKILRRPEPIELTAYCDCEQPVLKQSQLMFKISGASNYIRIAGLAEPDKVNAIISKIVRIESDCQDATGEGLIGKPCDRTPEAQVVILTAGMIAAYIVWILTQPIMSYLIDQGWAFFIKDVPMPIVSTFAEACWLVYYYGWKKILRGLKLLYYLPRKEAVKTIKEAIQHQKSVRDLEDTATAADN